jgi:hypothetical protein
MAKENIGCFDFEREVRRIESGILKSFDDILPKVEEMYSLLVKKNFTAKIDTSNDNLRGLFNDDSCYIGVLDTKLNFKSRALYLYNGRCQWVMIFNPKKRTVDNETIRAGYSVYRVYNEVDLDCIENSWGLKTTEQFITGVDLIAECFTDVTKHSQKVDKQVVCHRPTTQRLIHDYNTNAFQHYYPTITSMGHFGTNGNLGEVGAVFSTLLVMCYRLKIKGVEL